MFDILVKLESASQFSYGAAVKSERMPNESHDAYDQRVWREKCHVDPKTGNLLIPGIMFKRALEQVAQHLGEKIEGRGNATWTKHFRAGVHARNGIVLPYGPDKAHGEDVYCYAQGNKKPNEPRVWRRFVVIPEWSGEVLFSVLDPKITVKTFLYHIKQAGILIGIGRWAAREGGGNGAFVVKGFTVSNERLLEEEEMEEQEPVAVAAGNGRKGRK